MRKYIREIMRTEGKTEKRSPSIWVRSAFHLFQQKKYGAKKRSFNQFRSTRKKYLWRTYNPQ